MIINFSQFRAIVQPTEPYYLFSPVQQYRTKKIGWECSMGFLSLENSKSQSIDLGIITTNNRWVKGIFLATDTDFINVYCDFIS
jgi:hypothetical protein